MKSLDKESSNYENQRDHLDQVLRQNSFPEVPMDAYREQVIESIRNNPSSIIIGETGSGKSTRIPSYLLDAFPSARIAITQPRRVAARSVASYVAGQRGSKIGGEVGYKIRFDNETTGGTRATFMTDGILLKDLQSDPLLCKYDIVIVDEAHERNLNIDFSLGLLKRAQRLRREKGLAELKIVVTSATLEKEKFTEYFSSSSAVEVPGKMYPVQIEYVKDWREEYDCVDDRGQMNIFRLASKRVEQAMQQGSGDILIFMPGKDEIEKTIKEVEKLRLSNIELISLHGALSPEEQDRVFKKTQKRKIIVATNIAETSLTIDGVRFVIDSGLIKQKEYNAYSGIESLGVKKHAQSGCNQRAGRAGRTAPGICYRLYTEDEYSRFEPYQKAEILRSNLDHVILTMKAMGIQDIRNFDFIDSLPGGTITKGIETLKMLGALNYLEDITKLGRRMVDLPLRPEIARMVIEAEKYGCVEKICTIAAMIGERSVFVRPRDKELEADQAHEPFRESGSDFLTLLEVWEGWSKSGFSDAWARENFLHVRQLNENREVRLQLLEEVSKADISVQDRSMDVKAIQKCIASGLMHHLMVANPGESYQRIDQINVYDRFFIHPSSAAFYDRPHVMIGANVVATTRNFARLCQPLKAEWVLELAPDLFREGEGRIYYDADQNAVVERVPLIYVSPVRAALPALFGRNEPYYRQVSHFDRAADPERAAQLLAQLILNRELDIPSVSDNRRTAAIIRSLYHRSGGQVRDLNLEHWYIEKLRGCNTYAQVRELADELTLKLEAYCSDEQRALIERDYPEEIRIKGVLYPIKYTMRDDLHEAVVLLPIKDIFQLQESDLPILGASEKPLYLMVQSNVVGSKPDTLRAVKRSLNEEKLEEVWTTWLEKNVILLEEISIPFPTAQSLGKMPVVYGYDHEGKEAFAYPAIQSERSYDPFKRCFTYEFYLSYFRNAEEALSVEAEARKDMAEIDSNKALETSDQGLAKEIEARRQGLEIMINRADLNRDQLIEFRSKQREIAALIYGDRGRFIAAGGWQHAIEMIKRIEQELEAVINDNKPAPIINPLSGVLKDLMDKLPDRSVPSPQVQPEPHLLKSDIVDDSEAESEDDDQEEEAEELEVMAEGLRNELLVKLNLVQRILEEVSETPKAEMWKKNATQINKFKKQAADSLSKVKDLELTLAKSEQNDSFDQKVENALMEAKKLLDKMKEVGGVAASWSERYNSMLELDIPSIESAYGGKISAKNLSELQKGLIKVAKNHDLSDTRTAIEEMVAEKLLAQ